jgi:hypothetical protein
MACLFFREDNRMGATSWHYFTPYQLDPEAALQRLRTDVFAQGRFLDVAASPEAAIRQLYERAGLGSGSPEAREAVAQATRMQRALESGAEEDIWALPRALRSSTRRACALRALFPQPSPGRVRRSRSIDELLEQAGESGTHSILDITRVASRRVFAAAVPLPTRVLNSLFGTAEPLRGQVEEHWADIAERVDPWQAYYLVVFGDGRPLEYAFIGCSGD